MILLFYTKKFQRFELKTTHRIGRYMVFFFNSWSAKWRFVTSYEIFLYSTFFYPVHVQILTLDTSTPTKILFFFHSNQVEISNHKFI